jgi:glycosyltransferase involved in cell wall biosynthesis
MLGNGNYHRYFTLQKQVQREDDIIRRNTWFVTRTHWDKTFISRIHPNARLLHCDELLRDSFHSRQWSFHQQPEQPLRLISVMNGEIYKGLDNILRIASILKKRAPWNFSWQIIGMETENPVRTLFEQKTGLRFSDNGIEFAGMKKETELAELLVAADLFIHPTHIDNSPNSVCEAMLVGMPVLCSNVGGCSSLITDGKDGILLPDYEPEQWANELIRLSGQDELLKSLGREARITALRRHDRDTISTVVFTSYQHIIEQQSFSGI